MKKELKRYTLVEYAGIEYREYNTAKEYEDLLKKIKKYNKKDNNKYLFGNVTYIVKNNKYCVSIRKYKKIFPKCTISELDNFTSKYNQKELLKYFNYNDKNYNPDINIAYLNGRENGDINFANVKISYLPILYFDDIKYLSKKYVMKCVEYHLSIKDYSFFLKLCNKFECHRVINEDIEKLRIAINKCKYSNQDDSYILKIVDDLYNNFIYERTKDSRLLRDESGNIEKSHRRIRDFGMYVRDYGMLERKKTSPFKYNETIIEDVNDDDRLQDEYATYSWDQDNGMYYDNFEIGFDNSSKKYIRK